MRVIHRDAALVLSVDIASSFYWRQTIERLDGGGRDEGGSPGGRGRERERKVPRSQRRRSARPTAAPSRGWSASQRCRESKKTGKQQLQTLRRGWRAG